MSVRRRCVVLFFGTVLASGAFATPAGAKTIKVDALADGFADNAKCGLREAVQAANTNTAGFGCTNGRQNERDTIVLKAKAYQLTVPTTNEDSNQNGDLDVPFGGPLTVKGAGRGATSIVQTVEDRVFEVPLSQGDLTLQGLRITGGDVRGFSAAEARGGAARTVGELNLSKVAVGDNSASVGGGAYASNSAALKSTQTRFAGNAATAGGAISLANSATATVKRSIFAGNDVSTDGDVQGGAINHASLVEVKITDSTFLRSKASSVGVGNTALGGAIRSSGPLTIRRSLFSSNTTSAGTDNVQEHGGAIYTTGGNPEIVNSTFHRNRAGLGDDDDGRGGALFVNAGSAVVRHATFRNNVASDAGGNIAATSPGTIAIFGSILAGGDPCGGDLGFGSEGFNVAAANDPDCSFVGNDLAPATLGLGPLRNNGGPTQTVAISKGSDARNFVAKAPCKTHTGGVDQRGFKRPVGKRCDAGAFERGARP